MRDRPPADAAALFQWLSALQKASLYVLSDWDEETVEDLQAMAVANANQVQKLVTACGSVVVLPDAHKTLAIVKEAAHDR